MTSRVLLASALMLASTAPAFAQSISLRLSDGRVTLITQNATPSAILAEWARQGQVQVVDGERVPGTPLTLRLEDVPEREALDIVLRSATGYIAAPRAQAAAANLSRFDRVIVMPTSPGAGAAARASASPANRTTAVAPVQSMPVQAEEEVAQVQPGVVDDAPAAAPGAETPASSTNFDYANPQRYFAARQAEQQAADAAAQQEQQQVSQPSASPYGALGQTSARPGVAPVPQNPTPPAGSGTGNTMNPYGLPAGEQPGSAATPSTLEPDRAKYINPYSPTPPRP